MVRFIVRPDLADARSVSKAMSCARIKRHREADMHFAKAEFGKVSPWSAADALLLPTYIANPIAD